MKVQCYNQVDFSKYNVIIRYFIEKFNQMTKGNGVFEHSNLEKWSFVELTSAEGGSTEALNLLRNVNSNEELRWQGIKTKKKKDTFILP